MEISHVIRGEDHLSNTPKHILLFRALGYPVPALRPPAADPQPGPDQDEQAQEPDRGRRTTSPRASSARRSSTTSRSSAGRPGTEEEILSIDEIVERFDLERVHKGGAVFDRERLEWLNGQWIRRLEPDDLVDRLRPFVEAELARRPDRLDARPTTELAAAPAGRSASGCRRSARSATWSASCGSTTLRVDPALLVPKRWDAATTRDGAGRARDRRSPAVGAVTFEADELEPPLRALAEARGWKAGDLFMAIRVAVTGRTATPPLFDTLVALGRERTLERLDARGI